ncbi:hypothetical protein PAXRUDRAFT_789975 [Paxillus rubicundulus Ve08.2h10]|uniref:Uncharacterized protein n=1 Tax=Paxillus rubicundulus Ve08.2h10 TaxID=930991 RepID=A0A0D0CGV7_9AGAM|nr:hypothetical protein PAXRUDRAFT_789975 [Paxillus rubicundulus Ve08.2h10]
MFLAPTKHALATVPHREGMNPHVGDNVLQLELEFGVGSSRTKLAPITAIWKLETVLEVLCKSSLQHIVWDLRKLEQRSTLFHEPGDAQPCYIHRFMCAIFLVTQMLTWSSRDLQYVLQSGSLWLTRQ